MALRRISILKQGVAALTGGPDSLPLDNVDQTKVTGFILKFDDGAAENGASGLLEIGLTGTMETPGEGEDPPTPVPAYALRPGQEREFWCPANANVPPLFAVNRVSVRGTEGESYMYMILGYE